MKPPKPLSSAMRFAQVAIDIANSRRIPYDRAFEAAKLLHPDLWAEVTGPTEFGNSVASKPSSFAPPPLVEPRFFPHKKNRP